VSGIALFQDGKLDSLGLGKFDPLLLAFSDDEDVSETSCEAVSLGVLDVDNIEGSRVSVTAAIVPIRPWLAPRVMKASCPTSNFR